MEDGWNPRDNNNVQVARIYTTRQQILYQGLWCCLGLAAVYLDRTEFSSDFVGVPADTKNPNQTPGYHG